MEEKTEGGSAGGPRTQGSNGIPSQSKGSYRVRGFNEKGKVEIRRVFGRERGHIRLSSRYNPSLFFCKVTCKRLDKHDNFYVTNERSVFRDWSS